MTTKKTHQRAIFMGVLGFILASFLSFWVIDYFTLQGAPRVIVALIPAVPLTYGWMQYPGLLKALDELEQAIELEAMAKGMGIGLWVITLWALLTPHMAIPEFELFLVPPFLVLMYAMARWFVARKFK